MAKNTVSSSLLIPAPARRVYAIIADYREGHPRILPRPPFVSLSVEEGGVGEGTVIRCEMRMLGRLQAFHASITEPEPGRMLVETISETDTVTTYVIEPRENGSHAYVTISTVTQVREGVPGRLEGWLTSRLLQPVYVKELHQLAAVAAEQVR